MSSLIDSRKKRIKLCLNSEIKALPPPDTFDALKLLLEDRFKAKLPKDYKIYYFDADSDLITISRQEDYDIALTTPGEALKIYITDSSEESRQKLEKGSNRLSGYDLAESSVGPPDKKPESKVPQSPSGFEVIDKKEAGSSSGADIVPKQIVLPPSKPVSAYKPSSYDCIYCQGKKKTSDNKPCEECMETGKMSAEFLDTIRSITKLEVESKLEQEIDISASKLFLSHQMNYSIDAASNAIHDDIVCDQCGMSPIKGVRYNCSVCHNYDLCELCESKGTHPHPMLKIKKVQYKGSGAPLPGPLMETEENKGKKQAPPGVYQMAQGLPSHEKSYYYKMLSQSFKDGQKVEPKAKLSCVWKLKNTGGMAWPDDTVFKQIAGYPLNATDVKVGAIAPGQEVECRVDFIAPEPEGQAVTHFQLTYAEGMKKFGERVWVDFTVEKHL